MKAFKYKIHQSLSRYRLHNGVVEEDVEDLLEEDGHQDKEEDLLVVDLMAEVEDHQNIRIMKEIEEEVVVKANHESLITKSKKNNRIQVLFINRCIINNQHNRAT